MPKPAAPHRASAAIPLVLLALLSCQSDAPPSASPRVERALAEIRADELLQDIETLASDRFEGRAPATPGEALTVAHLVEGFQEAGLEPGNPDGTWVQQVPLVGITSKASAQFRVDQNRMPLTPLKDFVAVSRRLVPQVQVNDSQLVFVGYGVVAPEYGWDDFKDVDVRGKTVVMLVNDPPVPDQHREGELDPAVFRGRAMTYYGRWTYKYEVASARGAAAVLIVHDTVPAGYPFEVVSGSWGRENFDLRSADGNAGRVAIEGWITHDVAERLFRADGLDLAELERAAARRDFRPVLMDARADLRVDNALREVLSRNVVARLPGADPRLRDEHVVYTAHWDHLGLDPSLQGDRIFNGAVDNATGTAGLVALGRAFAALRPPPPRSILFLAVTAEEKGLLGSRHYATEPLYPLVDTVANVNMDGLNVWGRTRDVVVVGRGSTTLEELLDEEVRAQGRVLKDDPEPEKGYYYRSDHFEFAKRGVPALYADAGVDYVGRPAEWGAERRARYTSADYHKVSDEVAGDWDLSGMVEDLRLFFLVGLRAAEARVPPRWKEGSEFKAVRERMLAERAAR
jgi:Zn-dependent M28 family amino/carboxypeptidase